MNKNELINILSSKGLLIEVLGRFNKFGLIDVTEEDLLQFINEKGIDLKKICCLCYKPIIGYGNNAAPIKSGLCCDQCNLNYVIPIRIRKLSNEKNI